jgi:hypothetical protein
VTVSASTPVTATSSSYILAVTLHNTKVKDDKETPLVKDLNSISKLTSSRKVSKKSNTLVTEDNYVYNSR